MDTAQRQGRSRGRAWSAALLGVALACLTACATGTTPAGGTQDGTQGETAGETAGETPGGAETSASPSPTPTAPDPTPTTIAESYARNDDADVTPAARDTTPGYLRITTWGSSTCPELPLSAEWDADRTVLSVRAAFDNGRADTQCTMDYVPTTSVIAVDDLPDTAFTVRLNGVDTVVPATS